MAPFQSQSRRSVTAATTTTQIAPPCIGAVRRVQLVIINLSATTLTIGLGDDAVTASVGIILAQNQTYIETDDAAFSCWQGAVQAIGSASSTVSITERFAEGV